MNNLNKFNQLVEAFEELPTIGKKTAIKLAFFIIKNHFSALKLSYAIESAINNIKECSYCGNISEDEICDICLNIDNSRDNSKLCLVQNQKDILTIENTKVFDGKYFVFDDIKKIDKLKEFISYSNTQEIIFAFSPSAQNDALILLIEDKLDSFNIKFTKIAQGIPTGISLENIDSLSISKAIESRTHI